MNSSVNISGLELNGGHINLKNNLLAVNGFTSFNEANVRSNQGKVQTADFAEIKNSEFHGSITLEKTGGTANSCYGGNTFSTEVKFTNSSGSSLEVASAVNNVVIKFDE